MTALTGTVTTRPVSASRGACPERETPFHSSGQQSVQRKGQHMEKKSLYRLGLLCYALLKHVADAMKKDYSLHISLKEECLCKRLGFGLVELLLNLK